MTSPFDVRRYPGDPYEWLQRLENQCYTLSRFTEAAMRQNEELKAHIRELKTNDPNR